MKIDFCATTPILSIIVVIRLSFCLFIDVHRHLQAGNVNTEVSEDQRSSYVGVVRHNRGARDNTNNYARIIELNKARYLVEAIIALIRSTGLKATLHVDRSYR